MTTGQQIGPIDYISGTLLLLLVLQMVTMVYLHQHKLVLMQAILIFQCISVHGAGSAGVGSPGGGSDINITLAAGQVSISGFLESRVSILPASAAVYRTTLELYQD